MRLCFGFRRWARGGVLRVRASPQQRKCLPRPVHGPLQLPHYHTDAVLRAGLWAPQDVRRLPVRRPSGCHGTSGGHRVLDRPRRRSPRCERCEGWFHPRRRQGLRQTSVQLQHSRLLRPGWRVALQLRPWDAVLRHHRFGPRRRGVDPRLRGSPCPVRRQRDLRLCPRRCRRRVCRHLRHDSRRPAPVVEATTTSRQRRPAPWRAHRSGASRSRCRSRRRICRST